MAYDRSTPEGREKHNAASSKSNRKRRSTPEGRLKANAASAKYMRKLRSTPEGREKANGIESGCERAGINMHVCAKVYNLLYLLTL
jgi:hypothetical protein